MRLVIAGCEYSGASTLAFAIDDWMERNIGARMPLIHDHWKLPDTSGHPQADMTADETRQVLALSSELKEMHQRHSLYYHIQANSWNGPDWMGIGMHIDDGFYGSRYYDYGGDGKPHDRKVVGQQVESSILRFAPDMVLVHVKASAEVIAERMKAEPRANSPFREEDIEDALRWYEDAAARSLLRHKIELDTSSGSVSDAILDFERKILPHLSDADKSRILVKKALGIG